MVQVLEDETMGPRLLGAFRVLYENGYEMRFGDVALSGDGALPNAAAFRSPPQLVELLQGRYKSFVGEEWFGLRKNIPIRDRLPVSSENLMAEIELLFPAFELIAQRPE